MNIAVALGVLFAHRGRSTQKQPEVPKINKNAPRVFYFDNYGKMQESMNEYTVFKCEAENKKKAKFKYKEWKRKNFSK